jgi:hypothetical protein
VDCRKCQTSTATPAKPGDLLFLFRGSFERLSNENFRLTSTLQALFALVDALSKTVLACIPGPPAEAKPQAVALARERYHRLIKSAGAPMPGDSSATMKDILSHDSER